ncbi:MAG: hypothetical protein WC779_05050 [Candidatus Omnitrophota bacterium]|jgi:acetate kinase
MKLVVDIGLKEIKFWIFKDKREDTHPSFFVKDIDDIRADAALEKFISSISGKGRISAVSFRILFGGDYFNEPARISPKFFTLFGKLTEYFPFYVPLTLDILKSFRRVFKGIPLTAFFETSFFSKLPEEEKYYALPFEYYKNNKIKKWGFHGIYHEANGGMFPSGEKTISIVFDKQTTVCAVHNKRPYSISLGYTPLEGVMSRTSCGDLDPGIIFYLMNVHKFSIYKIDEMLKNESGFLGLTGYDIDLKDMLKLHGKDAKVDLAFDIYLGQIMKHIGEGISAMGGLDNIVFAGCNSDIFIPIIYELVKKLSFLGISTLSLPWAKNKEVITVSSEGSKVKVYVNRMDPARIIFLSQLHTYQ